MPAQKVQDINDMESNFRCDVIAAEMIDSGIEADKIVILRREGNVRQTDKEVLEIEHREDYHDKGNDTWILKTNRQGIYDNLPESLFHDSATLKENSKEAIIHSFRNHGVQEQLIRRFFSLYEAELDRARIDIQLAEYHYDRPDKHRTFVDTMSVLWPFIKQMESCSAMLFVRTVPYISQIRCSYEHIAQTLSLITGYLVCIERGYSRMPEAKSVRLSLMRLGVNLVLKGHVNIPCMKIMVTPNKQDINNLLPGKKQYLVLKALLKIFMPASIDNELIIKPQLQHYTACLGNNDNPCLLGVNMRLGSKRSNNESKKQ